MKWGELSTTGKAGAVLAGGAFALVTVSALSKIGKPAYTQTGDPSAPQIEAPVLGPGDVLPKIPERLLTLQEAGFPNPVAIAFLGGWALLLIGSAR